MTNILNTLKSTEFAPYYATYLEQVDDSDMIAMMITDLENQLIVLESIEDEKYLYRYAEGKWSIAELILHICDSESVFAYRALTFAREDKTDLPGFEQNDWAANSKAKGLSKKNIIGLFKTTRNHSIALYKSFNEDQLMQFGSANKANFSVRALGYTIIGHNRHHFKILNNIYLSK